MKFEFYGTDKGFRKGILFLAGRGKPLSSFNITSTRKEISIEESFRKRCQTCLVEFDEEDLGGYRGTLENAITMEPLIEKMDPKVKWIVAASSMGAYFASLLPEEIILGMVLIDPVTRLFRNTLEFLFIFISRLHQPINLIMKSSLK